MTGSHAETDACDGHCAIHGVDEPGPGYRCPECGHLHDTERDWCPLCLHDF